MSRFCKFPKQNRELPYASARQGKPARGRQILVPVKKKKYWFKQMQLAKRWQVCGSHGKRICHMLLVLADGKEIVKVEPQTVLGKRLEE
jgi:hypothetical protein